MDEPNEVVPDKDVPDNNVPDTDEHDMDVPDMDEWELQSLDNDSPNIEGSAPKRHNTAQHHDMEIQADEQQPTSRHVLLSSQRITRPKGLLDP